MKETQKWIRYLVLGSMAASVMGVASLASAKADVTFAGQSRRYHENDWRRMHPDWNGHLYWHRHHYYYDSGFTAEAIVDTDYGVIGGGVALDNDPYISFSGSYGQLYPAASLEVDLGSSDRERHARATYFEHPSFTRNGVRYDRTTVTRHGTTYYRFSRHR